MRKYLSSYPSELGTHARALQDFMTLAKKHNILSRKLELKAIKGFKKLKQPR